jgi:hypothetical protein
MLEVKIPDSTNILSGMIKEMGGENSCGVFPKEFIKLCEEYDYIADLLHRKVEEMIIYVKMHPKEFCIIQNLGGLNGETKREEETNGKRD